MDIENKATIETNATQGRLGPHELQEAQLMLAGKKEVAYFHRDYPEIHFREMKKCIEAGLFESRRFYDVPPREGLVVWVPHAKEKAMRLIEVITYSWNNRLSEEVEREIGRLLGYSEQDIDFYIAHLRRSYHF